MGFFSRLFGGGEDDTTRIAKQRMQTDRQDPRKAFIWGVVAVSYEIDPAYQPDHATEAIRDWYGVESVQDILTYSVDDFGYRDSIAYNQYRLCFIARAAYGAGMIDEPTSWNLALRHAAALQPHYPDWRAFGQGYLEGHLGYRKTQGDRFEQLSEYRKNINQRLLEKQRDWWTNIAWSTPLVGPIT